MTIRQTQQATVHRFDDATGAGAVITDDGRVIPFELDAWTSGPLRTLRVGQRLAVTLAPGDQVSGMTLVTFPHQ
jgi:cold shock CspA family protein